MKKSSNSSKNSKTIIGNSFKRLSDRQLNKVAGRDVLKEKVTNRPETGEVQ